MKHSRLHWDTKIGWIIDVEVTISDYQLRRVCDWAVPRQIDRWRTLPMGPKKDELATAIKKLQKYQISQRLLDSGDGTGTLFKATQGTGKIISVGGF